MIVRQVCKVYASALCVLQVEEVPPKSKIRRKQLTTRRVQALKSWPSVLREGESRAGRMKQLEVNKGVLAAKCRIF